MTNTAVAAAADGSAPGGGLLAPLDILTREGVPLSSYQLESNVKSPSTGEVVGSVVTGTSPFDIPGETQRLILSGLFTLVRLLVGLCCWLIGFIFRFPLLTLLTDPSQNLADAYQRDVVDTLGLPALLLAWAFVFGLIAFVRGKVGQGLGEIALTLVIAGLAASAFVRPDYLLGRDGPLAQTHRAAVEVAAITTDSYFGTPANGGRPCDSAVGPAHEACVNEQADSKTVTTPIQNALTDALVVKPYMLIQYGRVLDPKKLDEAPAYKAHLKWVQGNAKAPPAGDDGCQLLDGEERKQCEAQQEKAENCGLLDPQTEKRCRELVTNDAGFPGLVKDLNGAGPVGKSAALYAQKPSWDRVWAVMALLVAVIVVALMIISMSVVMLGAQGADAATAAGGPVAWVWAMLPGPSRMLLWRWLGVFVVSALVAFVAAMVMPMFGIAVDALLADTGPEQMMERLLLVDALAVAFLVLHRRILSSASAFGQRMATRMRFSKIGGSHLRGDNSEFGASLAMHGPATRLGMGGGLSAGPSAVHGAFGARLRSLGSMAALSDGTGMPFSPGRLLGDAMAEGRRGIAPLALALRGAHAALIGPKPGQHPAAAQLHAHANSHAGGDEPVVDTETGQVLHDPATDRPLLGNRIHARASRLRGYRIASRTARIAYGATLGLPRTLHNARSKASQYTQDARQQLSVTANHLREDGHAWAQGGRAVRDRVDHTGQVLATKWQVHDPAGKVRDTAIAATIATAPLADAPRPVTPTSVSRPLSSSTRAAGVSGRRAKASRDGNTAAGRAAAPDGGTTASGGRTAGGGTAATASRRQSQPWPQPRPRPQAQRPAPGEARSEDEARAAEEANRERLRRMFERRVAEAERRRREGGGES
ncbi:hypothetical protein [Streptomyces sp. NPDC048349]|uniref:hypothetical protein n=1 Tax=Streptomyces sp. NPDC048349 TaxID=3155486 RepID=UPI0034316C4F